MLFHTVDLCNYWQTDWLNGRNIQIYDCSSWATVSLFELLISCIIKGHLFASFLCFCLRGKDTSFVDVALWRSSAQVDAFLCESICLGLSKCVVHKRLCVFNFGSKWGIDCVLYNAVVLLLLMPCCPHSPKSSSINTHIGGLSQPSHMNKVTVRAPPCTEAGVWHQVPK